MPQIRRTYLATPLSLFRWEIPLQKRIVLHGGVAAALTPIALHHATKILTTCKTRTRESLLGSKTVPQKKLCDKDFAERSGEFSGAICLQTLVLLGNHPVAPSNCSDNFLVLFVRFFCFVGPLWLLTPHIKNNKARKRTGTGNQNRPNRVFQEPKLGDPLAHQNRTIAIASDLRVDGAKSPEILQKKRGFGFRNRSPKSQIASDFPSHP